MEKRFEITDSEGTIESGLYDLDDAINKLEELIQDNFEFVGEVRIVEVHYILA